MPDLNPLNVSASETGVIRVFIMNMPPEQARFQGETEALEQLFNVPDMDIAFVDIFRTSDLGQYGLAGYIVQGCGVPEASVEPEWDALNALTGYVMLVHSPAFGGRAVTLVPDQRLTLFSTLNVPANDWSGEKIETQSAQLYTSTPTPPRQVRANARRSGAIVFTVFMLIVAAILFMVLR